MTDREAVAIESLRKAISNAACYFDPDDLHDLVVGMADEAHGVDDEDDFTPSPTKGGQDA